MPKTTVNAPNEGVETAAAETKSYFESMKDTLSDAAGKMEVPAAARDFVAKTAATAKERVADVHAGAEKLTDNAEKLTHSFIGGYANFLRGLLDMSHANMRMTLETIEKVVAAKSVNEAVQIQVDAVREGAKANFERVKTAAETARTSVVDGAKTVQAEMSKMYAKAA